MQSTLKTLVLTLQYGTLNTINFINPNSISHWLLSQSSGGNRGFISSPLGSATWGSRSGFGLFGLVLCSSCAGRGSRGSRT